MKDIRVAKVLDDYRVVINAGSVDGIEEGTRVLLYENGEDIVDPITQENLGTLEIVKGTGVVTHLQDRIATVESNMKKDAPKTIRRKNLRMTALTSIATMMQPFEIIEELPNETKPFESPAPGNYVRIIRK